MTNDSSPVKLKDGFRGGDALAVPVEEIQQFVADWNAHLEKERQKAEEFQRRLAKVREAVQKSAHSAPSMAPAQATRTPLRWGRMR